jgi:hypothetical protein
VSLIHRVDHLTLIPVQQVLGLLRRRAARASQGENCGESLRVPASVSHKQGFCRGGSVLSTQAGFD